MPATEELRRDLMGMVPDDPVWIEARSILLDTESRIFGSVDGYVLRSDRMRLAAIGARASEALIREALGDIGDAGSDPARLWATVIPGGFTQEARAALESWTPDEADIHREGDEGGVSRRPVSVVAGDVRPIRTSDELRLETLPSELAAELAEALERAEMVATWVDGRPVSFCYVACQSETLWDVSINTAPEYRRRGLAAECVAFLTGVMKSRGKRAVWGAHSGNAASRRLARKLGFEPWGRLSLFENWAEDPAAEAQ